MLKKNFCQNFLSSFLIHVRAVFPTYRNWSVGLHWNSIEWLLCDWTIAVTLIDEWILSVNVIKLKDVEISIQTISEKCQTPVTGFFLTEVAVCQLYQGRTLLLMFLLALNIKHPTSQNDAKPDKTTHNQPNPPTTSQIHPQISKIFNPNFSQLIF